MILFFSIGLLSARFKITAPVVSSFTRTTNFTKSNIPQVNVKQVYSEGMIVKHNTFGVGKIIKTVPAGSDILLEIQFERVGFKKLMAGFAKLKII